MKRGEEDFPFVVKKALPHYTAYLNEHEKEEFFFQNGANGEIMFVSVIKNR